MLRLIGRVVGIFLGVQIGRGIWKDILRRVKL